MAFGNLRRSGTGQVTLGVLSVCTGIALLGIWLAVVVPKTSNYIDRVEQELNNRFSDKPSPTVTTILATASVTSPLYCGIFYIIAGAIGTCATAKRADSISCIRICFIIFSIFAILAAIVQTALSAFYSWTVIYAGYFQADPVSILFASLMLVGAILGFLELFFALVSSCIGCCCPGYEARGVHYQMTPVA